LSREIARRVLTIEAEARRGARRTGGLGLRPRGRSRRRMQGPRRRRRDGKSGIVCQKIAATLSSTGTPAYFLHPAEALHGDIGLLVPGDVVLIVSNSGETEELVRCLELVRRIGVPIVALTGRPGFDPRALRRRPHRRGRRPRSLRARSRPDRFDDRQPRDGRCAGRRLLRASRLHQDGFRPPASRGTPRPQESRRSAS
jgi:hypothetical protein